MATRVARSTLAARAVSGAAPAVVRRVAGDSVPLEAAVERVLAARLRELRLRLGWSLAQLATATGLSKGMLSKIENGRSGPSLGTLSRLATALDVPLTAFFRGLQEESDVLPGKGGRGLGAESAQPRRAPLPALGCDAWCAPTDGTRPAHGARTNRGVPALPARGHRAPVHGQRGDGLRRGRQHVPPRAGRQPPIRRRGRALGPQQLIEFPLQFLSVKAHGHAGK